MKFFFVLLAFFIVVGIGCVQTTEEELLDLDDVKNMTIAEEDIEVNKNFELSKHTTYFASSPDGIEWTLREEPIAHYASVPELVVTKDVFGPFPNGTLLTYFVDGTQGHDKEDVELGLVYSLDNGETWSDRLYTTMDGMPADTIAVDPSLVFLDDGRLRLYYFDFGAGVVSGGPVLEQRDVPSTYEFHTAISENGIDFVYEGLVYSADQIVTDPDVVSFDGLWRMYFMSQADASMAVSVSKDPLVFSSKEKVNDEGIPGVIVMEGEIWLFSCGQEGITRLTSQDGVVFKEVDHSVVSVSAGIHCDPSPARLKDGSYGMVFKHIRAQDTKPMGQQP